MTPIEEDGFPFLNNFSNANQSPERIFSMILGANQSLPNMLAAHQLGAVNNFGNQLSNAMGQIGAVNSANQQAALGLQGLQAQEDMQRYGNQANLTSSLANQAMRLGTLSPLLSQLIGGLTGRGFGGSLLGAASTNSPQSAYLPQAFYPQPQQPLPVSNGMYGNTAMSGQQQPFNPAAFATNFLKGIPNVNDWSMRPSDIVYQNSSLANTRKLNKTGYIPNTFTQ